MSEERATLAGSTVPEPVGPVPPKTDAGCAEPAWREDDRLAALERYAILDTGREAAFDEVAALAADLLDAPMGVVNLIASDRQWFKAEVGIGTDSLPLDVSICRHAILQPGVMVVPDLQDDPRFEGNPLIHVAGGLRFYAGALLETPEGLPLGTVCVLDREPRPEGITERQRRALSVLASQVMAQIELRRAKEEAQATARRQAFLLRLDEALRAAGSPDEAKAAAAELLGRELDVGRVTYMEVDEKASEARVASEYLAPGMPPSVGTYRLAELGPVFEAYRTGEPFVVEEHRTDPRTAALARLPEFAATGVRSVLDVPLLRAGRIAGVLVVNGASPRRWTSAEIELVQTVAERTRAAVERAAAEAALRESEARYRQIVEGADDFAIVTLDEAGTITGWNSGAERMMGWTREEAAGEPSALFFTPEDVREAVPDREMARALADGRAVNERWHVRRDGSRFWGSGLIMRLEAGGFLKMFRDRTAEHEAEAQRRDGEARLARAVAVARLGTFEWDLATDAVALDGRSRELFGFKEGEATTALEVFARIHPDDFPRVRSEAAASAAALSRLETEYRVCWPDGTERTLASLSDTLPDREGRARQLMGVFADVTERKAAEAALRDLNATLEAQVRERTAERHLLATIVESTDVIIMAADLDYGILAINEAFAQEFERAYGIRPKAGDNLLALLADRPEDQAQVRAGWAPALAGEEFTFVEEFSDPARARPYYEVKFRTLRDAAGERIGAYQFVTDVTERLRDQAQLTETQEALRQSQKMEAMGQLTGGVAHDFNNLLTPIIGSLDRLVTRGVGSERERRLMAGALESAERAKVLVQRLLAFARRQPLQPVAVDMGALVESMKGLIGSTLGPKIDLRVDVAPGLAPAHADANQLEMALLNLAVNARDAMPEGGVLAIEAAPESVRGPHLAGLKRGHYVRLAVADTGTGMDEATLARAVEPFFSTKGIGRGTGLGLSMVHGLAAQLGGGLAIDSAPGQGTTVALWLPISARPISEAEAGRAAPEAILPRGRALLVDDEELVRMSTADMLMDLGFEVLEAGSAEDALGLLQEGATIDLLVTDHLMPGMSGADLAREVRLSSPGLPVLIVSGYAEAEGIAPNLPRLVKPFRAAELAERVAALMPDSTPAE